jgi:hypothetical protein
LANSLTRQQFATRSVFGARGFTAARHHLRDLGPQIRHEIAHGFGIRSEIRAAKLQPRLNN